MKFSDYDKKSKENKKVNKEFSSSDKQKLFSMLRQFEGKSEDEIIASILQTAEKNRAEGKLSDSEIDSFYSMISPMLDEKKREKLDGIIELIKSKK